MSAPLSLSDHQLEMVQQAASMLALRERDHFMRSVASRVVAIGVDDAAIATAIQLVLSGYGVSVSVPFKRSST
jgi:hypothetical protein